MAHYSSCPVCKCRGCVKSGMMVVAQICAFIKSKTQFSVLVNFRRPFIYSQVLCLHSFCWFFFFLLFSFIPIFSDTKYREKATVFHYFLLLPIPYFKLQKEQKRENIVQSTLKFIFYVLNCICFLKSSSHSVTEKSNLGFVCLDCSTFQHAITETLSFSLLFPLLFFFLASSFAGLIA